MIKRIRQSSSESLEMLIQYAEQGTPKQMYLSSANKDVVVICLIAIGSSSADAGYYLLIKVVS